MNPSLPHLKILRNIFLFLVTSLIVSCHCDDMTCQGLKPELAAWIPNRVGDSIKFTNGTGNEILFKVINYDIAVTKNVDCHPESLGCYCPNCAEETSAYNAVTTDTSWALIDSLGNTLRTYQYMGARVLEYGNFPDASHSFSYGVFDHSNIIGIDSNFNIKLSGNDSLLSNFTIGARTYTNVVVHETDTASPPHYPHLLYRYFVIKSYYNKEYGVIAFYDLLTQSLFYREN